MILSIRTQHVAGNGGTRARQGGFTSVEILLATAVTLTILGGFAAVNQFQLGTLRAEAKHIRSRGVGRSVTDLFGREVRRAESVDPLPDVNGLRIRSDLNQNGTTDQSDDSAEEDVLYGLYDGALWRKSGGPNSESPWERLSGENEMAGVDWYFEDSAGNEVSYAALQQLSPQELARIERAGLRLEIGQGASGGGDASRRVKLSTDSTLRKRFFVQAIGRGVNDAIYSQFDVDEFVSGLSPPANPTPPAACAAANASCTQSSQCCSNNCRPNGRCS